MTPSACYGIKEKQRQKDWYCDACEYDRNQERPIQVDVSSMHRLHAAELRLRSGEALRTMSTQSPGLASPGSAKGFQNDRQRSLRAPAVRGVERGAIV